MDILDLLTLNRPGVQEAVPTKVLSRLPADLANFFVRSLDATSDLRSPKRDLLRLFLVKLFLSFFPMSLPAATDAGHYAGADYDRVSGPRLLHYLRKHARMLEPRRLLSLACDVNAGQAVAG